jgi:hypothetical protein
MNFRVQRLQKCASDDLLPHTLPQPGFAPGFLLLPSP